MPDIYTSSGEVEVAGEIASIRVPNLRGTHFSVGDLSARLISPQGTEAVLFANVCGNVDDFNLSFSEGGLSEIDCPPTLGEFYQPQTSFDIFAGENPQGIWTLELEDSELSSGGNWDSWNLEICYVEDVFSASSQDPFETQIFPNPARDEVILSFSTRPEQVDLYDLQGKKLQSFFVNGNEIFRIPLGRFSAGTYLIQVMGKEGSSTHKLLIID
jgi:subtilisin-like proprotein convertase family protein